jgi:hypothetical protein
VLSEAEMERAAEIASAILSGRHFSTDDARLLARALLEMGTFLNDREAMLGMERVAHGTLREKVERAVQAWRDGDSNELDLALKQLAGTEREQ